MDGVWGGGARRGGPGIRCLNSGFVKPKSQANRKPFSLIAAATTAEDCHASVLHRCDSSLLRKARIPRMRLLS